MSALRFLIFPALILSLLSLAPSQAVRAQDRDVPYWASLRFDEVNMRVGPSGEYKIDWVYRRKGMPVKVIRTLESWRLVEDHEGTRGWIDRSQLTDARGAIVIGNGNADLRAEASASASLNWRAEPGVVAKLLRCREGWCEIDVTGRSGWVQENRLWGAGEP